jgi:hypothetical protein
VLTLVHWAIEQYEHIVSDLIRQRAANYLMEFGVEPAYIGVVATTIGLLSVKLFWSLVNDADAEPNWAAINPDDERRSRRPTRI